MLVHDCFVKDVAIRMVTDISVSVNNVCLVYLKYR